MFSWCWENLVTLKLVLERIICSPANYNAVIRRVSMHPRLQFSFFHIFLVSNGKFIDFILLSFLCSRMHNFENDLNTTVDSILLLLGHKPSVTVTKHIPEPSHVVDVHPVPSQIPPVRKGPRLVKSPSDLARLLEKMWNAFLPVRQQIPPVHKGPRLVKSPSDLARLLGKMWNVFCLIAFGTITNQSSPQRNTTDEIAKRLSKTVRENVKLIPSSATTIPSSLQRTSIGKIAKWLSKIVKEIVKQRFFSFHPVLLHMPPIRKGPGMVKSPGDLARLLEKMWNSFHQVRQQIPPSAKDHDWWNRHVTLHDCWRKFEITYWSHFIPCHHNPSSPQRTMTGEIAKWLSDIAGENVKQRILSHCIRCHHKSLQSAKDQNYWNRHVTYHDCWRKWGTTYVSFHLVLHKSLQSSKDQYWWNRHIT